MLRYMVMGKDLNLGGGHTVLYLVFIGDTVATV